ncbi:MAG: hypothetical protein SXQ77_05065 [Halobacteria archaeon]|nr:hypothetical protein [Halobacteria archaeon]
MVIYMGNVSGEPDVRYGNRGLLAQVVYDNFEMCLMTLAALVFGSILAPLLATAFGLEAGVSAVTFAALGIGLMLIGTHVIDERLFDYGLIDHFF